jgi:hypothetical protein
MTQYAEETDTQDLHRQEIEQRDATIALLKQQLEEKGRGANPDHIYLYGRLKDVEKELVDKDNMIEYLAQELNGTQKLLKDEQEQLAEQAELNRDIMKQMQSMIKQMENADVSGPQ